MPFLITRFTNHTLISVSLPIILVEFFNILSDLPFGWPGVSRRFDSSFSSSYLEFHPGL